MGIGGNDLDLVIALRQAGQFPEKGAVVEIGAQQLGNSCFDDGRLSRLAALFRADPKLIPVVCGAPLPDGPTYGLGVDAPLARRYWTVFGTPPPAQRWRSLLFGLPPVD
jgi:hypothetical protein